MAKFSLDIPDDLHDTLRMQKVKQKKDIRDIIIDYIQKGLGRNKNE